MFKFNSNQSPSKSKSDSEDSDVTDLSVTSESDSDDSDVTDLSVTDIENIIIGIEQTETFKWTKKLEICLLRNMTRLKPSGINKHLSVLLLKEKISKELKLDIPIEIIWNYLSTKWDIRTADEIEHIGFDTSKKDFVLPEEFDQLISEEGEKIKNLDTECLNDEINNKELLNWRAKTRFKSNSISSVDSKESLDETIPSRLLESSPAKTNEVGFDKIENNSCNTSKKDLVLPEYFDQLISEEGETIKKLDTLCLNDEMNKKELLNWRAKTRLEISPSKTNEVGFYDGPCTRRSLRTNEKLENSKSDEKNKLKDLKQINEKTSNQSKDVEKIEKISNFRGRKRRSSNVSEFSFSSNNSKQGRYDKNKLTDLTILDSSSRSVTPQILSGKTSNRSVTSETISTKSNLSSFNKDQKSKLLTQ